MAYKKVLSTLILTLFGTTTLYAEPAQKPDNITLKPFKAEYTLLHKSDPVGTGVRQLEQLADGNYRYSYHSKIKWLIFSDQRDEQSTLSFSKNQILPTHYLYKRTGTGKDKHYEWQFDRANNVAINQTRNQTLAVDFSQPVQDSLSYHLQQRVNLMLHPEQQQFVYSVISTSGKVNNKVYQYDGEEQLILPYGTVKALRYKREVIDKKRVTYAWFAPELDYLLVKLYQTKNGNEQFEIQLNKVKFN